MSIQIEMPELSSEGEGATLATWLVSVGDHVEKGDVIAELETDKATVELEAPASGTILAFSVEEGSEGILPGVVLANLDPDSAPLSEVADESRDTFSTAPTAPTAPTATPLARRAALDRDVDLSTVTGSGPGGRVVEEDVVRSMDSSLESSSAQASDSVDSEVPIDLVSDGFETVRLSALRKTIARRMTESKQQIPHFYLRVRCAMDGVMEARAKLNRELATAGRETRISINDFVLRATALALRDVPAANVSFAGSEMHVFDRIDVAVAVAIDGGLVAPVVREADRKGLAALADEMKELAALARAGQLRPEQIQGGTITLSNLGMYGIETVYPILNPPQACIVGVGAVEERPVVRKGEIVIGQIAVITLAADHRVVDGAVGAQLLAALRERLEDPLCMIL